MNLNKTVQASHSDWFVACAPYLEPLVADELTALGGEQVSVGHAGVTTSGPLALGYRIILWSRVASRVSRVLCTGPAGNREQLADLLDQIHWPDQLRVDHSFRVRFSGQNPDFRNTHFGAQWVKDRVVDQFRASGLPRPPVRTDPDLTLVVNLHSNRASVSVELNRSSLHRRGYRPPNAPAPLRETLAAAVLIRSGWAQELTRLDEAQDASAVLTLVDPMCGSGTLLLEGALMAYRWAPGLLRAEQLRSPGWAGHDDDLWHKLVASAIDRRDAGLAARSGVVRFRGNDPDTTAMAAARSAWQALGMPAADWSRNGLADFAWPAPSSGRIMAVANPPYGERLSRTEALPQLYSQLGAWLSGLPVERSRAGLVLAELSPVAATGLFYDKAYRVRNGDIDCRVYTFPTIRARVEAVPRVIPDLANRIRKNLKRLKPFLKQGITNAYRVYDADIPEYAVAVDVYDDWLHVQEYAPPKSVPVSIAEKRLQDILVTLPHTLNVPAEQMAVKQRQRQSGLQQYNRQGTEGVWLVVHEYGVHLRVNLTDYLDTGLFPDHRLVRFWLQQHSRGKRVLNLFSYTGVASVHAALGGAARVDSVDLSATYLAWAEDNFRLNGLDPEKHGFLQADALTWLAQPAAGYDLIFLDPPTFSNSKRMCETLDIQRDHQSLLKSAMSHLRPGGTLIFSTNSRRFRLASDLVENYTVIDYHKPSIPKDFARRPKIHQCWMLQHADAHRSGP